jgi:flagellar biosynthesis/type III secretory pathway chaperone
MSGTEIMGRPGIFRDDLRNELLSVMREQEALCNGLLEISGVERKLVLDGRISELEAVTNRKSAMVQGMESLELRRRELSTHVAAQLGLPADSPLTAIAAKMEASGARELLALRQRVSESVRRLSESNETNVMLMRKSLHIVRDSLQQFRRSMGGGESYTHMGRPSAGFRNNVMVDCHG